ncbi:undecaprenyldiphospho-muramoylpentapeptide beta-N-acetylglucosaminyltransferase [Granulosicoccaceae sp. 1_MG-2023]|nr:undecaprenyldiphospho-muramoylpentapeptide beta-N-acetylglucosaminyltransferase [Granulosicoccaceae sp. 1_MG-2023]
MSARPVMIAAGGTGGHVFPALVVADSLREKGIPVIWVGTQRGIESRVVPAAGLPIEWMKVAGLRGKNPLALIKGLFGLGGALLRAFRLIRKHRPRAVLGMGGFVTGPVGLMARLTGTPLVLHEQNALPGMTNKILSRVANRVLAAFPGALPGALVVGNPVRQEILDLSADTPSSPEAALRVLVVGGSLGARFFNETLPYAFAAAALPSLKVRHQCGRDRKDATEQAYQQAGCQCDVSVEEFIDDMAQAYAGADLVICRAGAMTVSELAVAGKPALFVPFPFAVDDHQTHNAGFLAEAGAAVVLQESGATVERLADEIKQLAERGRLQEMSANARRVAVRDATDKVVDQIIGVAR